MIQEQAASATIYQFPVGGRAGHRMPVVVRRPSMPDAAMPRGATLGAGESWYHAEAVEAAQQATIK